MAVIYGNRFITPIPLASGTYELEPLESASIPITVSANQSVDLQMYQGGWGQDYSLRAIVENSDRTKVFTWSDTNRHHIGINNQNVTKIKLQDIALKTKEENGFVFDLLPADYHLSVTNLTNVTISLNIKV